jgi:hypothetical protein
MSADPVPSSKTNIFQSKLIYCRHFRTYSRCAMFDWNDTVFRRRNVTRRRISNTVLQPRSWGREADSPEVCRLVFPILSVILTKYHYIILTDYTGIQFHRYFSSIILIPTNLHATCFLVIYSSYQYSANFGKAADL